MNRTYFFVLLVLSALFAMGFTVEEGGHGINWNDFSTITLVLACMPFVFMLLSIALLPLMAEHWWHHNKNQAIIAAIFGAPVALFYLARDYHTLLHTTADYMAFIALLASLFIISGGIVIKGSFAGKPATNLMIILIGAVLANFIGTTGAAMLLIRPLLQANKPRKHKMHVVIFFIFIVCNCGGLLTPLGDPPLFLGFLKGVPFDWTFHLLPEWFLCVIIIAIIFFFLDFVIFHKESHDTRKEVLDIVIKGEKFRILGAYNFTFLTFVIIIILLSGYVLDPHLKESYGANAAFFGSKIFQTVFMLLTAFIAYKLTPNSYRHQNEFTFYPIKEVAILFAGIFGAMMPALGILYAKGGEFGITMPWQFFWITGSLSSFLDNAPTYLTYTSLASGLMEGASADNLKTLIAATQTTGGIKLSGELLLAAISCGAVFMGAMTYIGNAPNFMVKSIAESSGIKMPSFFGYMKWSVGILVPVFILITIFFFTV